jgi:hypothetical protein
MFEKVKKKYAICIIYVSLTDFPEPSSVLASSEPDNDVAIRCMFSCTLAHVISKLEHFSIA